MRGNEAIEQLKKVGEYDSLRAALEVARQKGRKIHEVAAVSPSSYDPNFVQQQKLTASDGAPTEDFGVSVAISGDTAIVGGPRANIGANRSQGAAYIFVRNGATWTEQQKLTASDGTEDDFFGESVAISGDTAIIGAHGNEGAAYIFVRSGATWTKQQKLTGSNDRAALQDFGFSVAISGDTVIVGQLDYGD